MRPQATNTCPSRRGGGLARKGLTVEQSLSAGGASQNTMIEI